MEKPEYVTIVHRHSGAERKLVLLDFETAADGRPKFAYVAWPLEEALKFKFPDGNGVGIAKLWKLANPDELYRVLREVVETRKAAAG